MLIKMKGFIKKTTAIYTSIATVLLFSGWYFLHPKEVHASPTLVQTKTCNSSSATCNITMTSTTAGNLIVVSIAMQTSAANSITLSDNVSNTYVDAGVDIVDTDDFRATKMWYVANSTGGITSITTSSSGGQYTAIAQEWSGMASSNVIDVKGTFQEDSSVTTFPGPSLTTTNANTVIVAVLSSASAITSITNGFTDDSHSGGSGQFTVGYDVGHITNTSTGTYQPKWTQATGFGASSAVAFIASGATPTPPTPPSDDGQWFLLFQ